MHACAGRLLLAALVFVAVGVAMPAAQAEDPSAYGATASCQPGDQPETGLDDFYPFFYTAGR